MYAWILGVFVLSCCLILLHTYLRTDGLRVLFCCCGQVGSEEEEGKKRKERKDGGGLYIYQAGFYWGMLVHLHLLSYILFPRRESGDSPQLKAKQKRKKSELTKTPFLSFPHPRNQQTSPASATTNVEAVLVAKNISKNSKPNTGRANKSVWELRRKFKLLRD